jgi:hypothetical protein
VGIDESTLRCWLKIPEFAARVRQAQQQAFGHALGRLQAESGLAVDVLVRVLRKRKADDGLKVRAALGLLGHGLKASELHDLAERLAAIEAELAKPNRNGTTHSNGKVNGRAKA